MTTIPSSRSNVIYGDSSVQTATLVPTLTQGADGNSLKVTAEPDNLNMYQSLNLQDLFYDTRISRDYPQSVSNNIIAFVGTTQNWQLWSETFLELEATITFDIVAGVSATAGNVNALPDIHRLADSNHAGKIMTDFGYMNQPEFCFLQPIRRVEIKMGANNQVIGRYPMNYLYGILLNCKDKEYNNETKDIYTNFGLPYARAYYTNQLNGEQGAANPTAGTTLLPCTGRTYQTEIKDLLDAWNAKIKDVYATACQNYVAAGNLFSTGATPAPTTLSQNIKFAIPLNFLNSALDTPGYFPPGVPFRIEIEYNPNKIEIMNSYTVASTGTATGGFGAGLPGTPNVSNIAPTVVSIAYTGLNSVLHRREHMLRQPSQEKINVDWIRKPFLYNYETYEYYEFPVLAGQSFFKQEIAISQQRPTMLYFTIINTGLTTPGNYTMTFNGAAATNSNRVVLRHYPNAVCPGFRLSELKVYISGRQNYYLRTEYLNAGKTQFTTSGTVYQNIVTGCDGKILDATNACERITNAHVYQESFDTNMCKTNSFNMVEGSMYVVSINPGDVQKKSYISSDQGAAVVQCEFFLTDALNNTITASNYVVRVYKKLPEQFQLDAQKNITTISWPAAVADNKYIIPATYNLN